MKTGTLLLCGAAVAAGAVAMFNWHEKLKQEGPTWPLGTRWPSAGMTVINTRLTATGWQYVVAFDEGGQSEWMSGTAMRDMLAQYGIAG